MAYQSCVDKSDVHGKDQKYELVLKKWFDMPKANEWRCFVRDGRLIGEADAAF